MNGSHMIPTHYPREFYPNSNVPILNTGVLFKLLKYIAFSDLEKLFGPYV